MENSLNKNNNILLGKSKAKGPINIALIKYWGKKDENINIPLNDNLSITLDMENMYTFTEIELYGTKSLKEMTSEILIYLEINNKSYKTNKRQTVIIKEIAENYLCYKDFNKLIFYIKSINTFPTAAGCASSASGGACLAIALKGLLLNLFENNKEILNYNCGKDKTIIENLDLNSVSRRLSGSASRSIHDGFVVWDTNGVSKSIYSHNYWKELRVVLLVVSSISKAYSSTEGMKQSKLTSEFLNYRVNNLINKRIEETKKYIKNKNISGLCEITMKESNSLHSICLDTFPPILYMNETSFYIIKCINLINGLFDNINTKEFICGYTFDAGANSYIITTEDKLNDIINFLKIMLNYENNLIYSDVLLKLKYYTELYKFNYDLCKEIYDKGRSSNFKIENIISFKPGIGAHLV